MSRLAPSVLVAGVSSGCGKTTATLGLMAAFRDMGLKVQPFKCGPDFIDPSLHRVVTGRTSWNLDIRMCGKEYVKTLFSRKVVCHGINIVEGVMGLFDGGEASAASLARLLNIPVILVVDVSSAAESVAAVVRGFETLDPCVKIEGVILNQVASPRHLDMVKPAIKEHCKAKVVGAIPRNHEIRIPSRHLGLVMGNALPLGRIGQRLSDLIRENVQLDAILNMAEGCTIEACPEDTRGIRQEPKSHDIRIGVADDKAFCFYYRDNLDILEQMGAELVPFSPVSDRHLPKGLHGLYIGGGYPELYAEALSENRTMRKDILCLSRRGLPIFAECGGFMYLCRSITGADGRKFPMVGVFPAESRMNDRLASLGYREAKVTRDCPLSPKGGMLFGHEFHYSTTEFTEDVQTVFQTNNGRKEGYLVKNTLAGYIHLHFGRTPEVAAYFLNCCRKTGL